MASQPKGIPKRSRGVRRELVPFRLGNSHEDTGGSNTRHNEVGHSVNATCAGTASGLDTTRAGTRRICELQLWMAGLPHYE